jgi:hypothetical protein
MSGRDLSARLSVAVSKQVATCLLMGEFDVASVSFGFHFHDRLASSPLARNHLWRLVTKPVSGEIVADVKRMVR